MDGIKKILIMESDPMVNDMIIRHLKRKGFFLQKAQNADAAIDCIESADQEENGFDLVIADFFDTKAEGMMLLRWLKKSYPTLPLLLLSGYGTLDMTMEIVRDEIDGFCRTPLTPVSIGEAINEINAKKKLRQQQQKAVNQV